MTWTRGHGEKRSSLEYIFEAEWMGFAIGLDMGGELFFKIRVYGGDNG